MFVKVTLLWCYIRKTCRLRMHMEIKTDKWPLRYDLLQRYRLIEIIALWEGKLNASHLTGYFGIGRQQASKDINDYLRLVAPGNLEYNASSKGYEPSENFAPKLTSGLVDEYLQLAQRNSDLVTTFGNLSLGLEHTHMMPLPQYRVRPEIFRILARACQKGERLEVDYRSINSPDRDGRIIAPHSIVHSGLRWYVRAWCEKNQAFRDFVLTRFYGEPDIVGKSDVQKASDFDWMTQVNVCFKPDGRLTAEQQAIVAGDYGMTENRLLITVRGSMVQYLLQMMNVDQNTISADPKAQQIVIENIDSIKRWLF